MAKLLDPIDVKWRDSVGGITLAQGHETAVARRKVIPCNRRFSSQQSWREKQAVLTFLWRELSSADVNQWNWFGVTFAVTDKYGDSIYLNGYDWFIKLNARLVHSTFNPLSTPPDDDTPTYSPAITFSQIPPFTSIWISLDTDPTGDQAITVGCRLNLPLSRNTPLYPYWFRTTCLATDSFPREIVLPSELIFNTTRSFFRAFPMDEYGRSPGETVQSLTPTDPLV